MNQRRKTDSSIKTFLRSLLPEKTDILDNLRLFAIILAGGVLLTPLMKRLPLAGWDWYLYFTAHNPELNLYLPDSVYPPYTRLFLHPFLWMDWRTSFSLLCSLTLVTIAFATRRSGGSWVDIVLAIVNPPVIMLLWVGHPDGLALMGAATAFLPLAYIKPQLTIWNALINRKWFFWTVAFLILTLIIWPQWTFNITHFTGDIVQHRTVLFMDEATSGWAVLGWPIALLGVVLLLGAGDSPWRLMAAGSLISPYMMPYHLSILAPAIGAAQGWKKKLLIWLCAFLVFWGSGLRGWAKLYVITYPLAIYCCTISFAEYRENLKLWPVRFRNLLIHFKQRKQRLSLTREQTK